MWEKNTSRSYRDILQFLFPFFFFPSDTTLSMMQLRYNFQTCYPIFPRHAVINTDFICVVCTNVCQTNDFNNRPGINILYRQYDVRLFRALIIQQAFWIFSYSNRRLKRNQYVRNNRRYCTATLKKFAFLYSSMRCAKS